MPTRLSLRIRFERRSDLISLLSLFLLVAVFLVSLGLGSGAAASSSKSAPVSPSLQTQRKFYLTPSLVSSVDVLAACAPGYHMASLWEIKDTSNLEYNTTLGYTWAGDQGSGPPTYYDSNPVSGWVHTGAEASHVATPGLGNCDSWSGNISGNYGTVVYLDSDWTSLEGWQATIADCSHLYRLWCVADIVGERLYLPTIMRSP